MMYSAAAAAASMEVPAWISPTSLQTLSIRRVAHGVLHPCCSCSLVQSSHTITGIDIAVDDIIKNDSIHFHEARRYLSRILTDVRKWWESSSGLGCLPLILQKEVVSTLSEVLTARMHISPLYRLLLQLLLAREAGGATTAAENKYVKVAKEHCPAVNNFLMNIAPFSIESLNTDIIDFEDQHTLNTIIKNSPNLRKVQLNHRDSFSVLDTVARFCSKLEILVLANFYIPEECLYKTFFGGVDEAYVISSMSNVSNIRLSFPFLRVCVHKWGTLTKSTKKFLQAFLHLYPNLQKITAHDNGGFQTDILIPDIEVLFKNVNQNPCKLKAITLDVDCPLLSKNNLGKISKLCPEVRHLTVDDWTTSSSNHNGFIVDNFNNMIQYIHINSLSLHMPSDKPANYLPILNTFGKNLKALEIQLWCIVDADVMCNIINTCVNIESLSVEIWSIFRFNSPKLDSLPRLKRLSICDKAGRADVCPFVKLVLGKAPNVTDLEVSIKDASSFRSITNGEMCPELRSLTLHCPSEYELQARGVVVKMVSLFPALKTLTLNIRSQELLYYRTLYSTTALDVLDGRRVSHKRKL
ncbi:unnamed protein product [Meganyctiphanes norvegica]|uniref:Uncharacterized protein n=1 Tax=Meganyctiphanes norvegica TaxID=48144 RepID=A0AAV2QAY2_MEGNR